MPDRTVSVREFSFSESLPMALVFNGIYLLTFDQNGEIVRIGNVNSDIGIRVGDDGKIMMGEEVF